MRQEDMKTCLVAWPDDWRFGETWPSKRCPISCSHCGGWVWMGDMPFDGWWCDCGLHAETEGTNDSREVLKLKAERGRLSQLEAALEDDGLANQFCGSCRNRSNAIEAYRVSLRKAMGGVAAGQ